MTSFDIHHERYEAWFTRHKAAYHSELLAVRALLPWQGLGLEIGVGTGRFAAPLGVKIGVDPSMVMLANAAKRGVLGLQGTAEALPFKNAIFDFALVVTTICFVDDPVAMLVEARRVLKPGASLVIGFVDRASDLGRHYLNHQAENVFYREARFYSASEVGKLLGDTGFVEQTWGQTLSKPLNQIVEMEPFREGFGNGGFVVVSATKLHEKATRKKMSRLSKGYIHVYTGNGKGKTTAALGQALRAAGSGLKTFIVQFMKDFPYGEVKSVRQWKEWIGLEQYGNDAFVIDKRLPGKSDFEAAKQGLQRAQEAMLSGKYDLVIMDEVCVAIYFGLLNAETVLLLLGKKPTFVEMILTGRYCPSELIEKADLVTEMHEIKHYYRKGIEARKGIES